MRPAGVSREPRSEHVSYRLVDRGRQALPAPEGGVVVAESDVPDVGVHRDRLGLVEGEESHAVRHLAAHPGQLQELTLHQPPVGLPQIQQPILRSGEEHLRRAGDVPGSVARPERPQLLLGGCSQRRGVGERIQVNDFVGVLREGRGLGTLPEDLPLPLLPPQTAQVGAVPAPYPVEDESDALDVIVGGADEGDEALEGVLSEHPHAGQTPGDLPHAAAALRPVAVQLGQRGLQLQVVSEDGLVGGGGRRGQEAGEVGGLTAVPEGHREGRGTGFVGQRG